VCGVCVCVSAPLIEVTELSTNKQHTLSVECVLYMSRALVPVNTFYRECVLCRMCSLHVPCPSP
jgi:hypothetical protein